MASTRTSATSRAYALENAAFLRHLARTGNAHEAARALDTSRTRFTKRRAADPAFALRWDAALVTAQAYLSNAARLSNPARPNSAKPGSSKSAHPPMLTTCRDGTVQLRRRPATAITYAAEQAFLFALAASANVRLSAAATGFAPSSFYARKRRYPAFASQWALAVKQGYERIQMALFEGGMEGADGRATHLDGTHMDEAWSHNEPPPVPPMTANQAMQLLYLHQKEAKAMEPPGPLRRIRGESKEARNVRLTLIYRAWEQRSRDQFNAMDAARVARGEGHYWRLNPAPDPHEPPPPALPDLAQVTGWSKADPGKVPHDEKRALFGGWRIEDMRKK